jgi:hypothetical protein
MSRVRQSMVNHLSLLQRTARTGLARRASSLLKLPPELTARSLGISGGIDANCK